MSTRSEFRKLLAASFVSQTGSHFLTLALSGFVLLNTGSAVLSSLVFVFSFLPSVLAGPKLGQWVDQHVSKYLIARNELFSIGSTLLCGLFLHLNLPIYFLCAALALRSLLLFIGRSASTRWLKSISEPHEQSDRIKIYYLGFFLSTAVSGLLAAKALAAISIWAIVVIDCASYALALAFYLNLSPLSVSRSSTDLVSVEVTKSVRETLGEIFASPTLRVSFLIVCMSQAIFQGAYSSMVSFLPVRSFGIGAEGIGWFQIAASLGIIGGFLVNWFAPKFFETSTSRIPNRTLMVATLGIVSLVLCVGSSSIPLSLIHFLVFNFAYESVWLHHNSDFFRVTPTNKMATYQFTLASTAAFMMSVFTLGYSALVETMGTVQGTLFMLLAGIALSATLSRKSQGSFVPAFEKESSL